MPILRSAKKRLRQAKKRRARNICLKEKFKEAAKELKRNPSAKNLAEVQKAVDKAAKSGVIHKNKAARIKSSLSKLIHA